MNNDTATTITEVEAMDDGQLAKELAFATGFGPDLAGSDYSPSATWLAIVQHESRRRGQFVPGDGYATIEDWLADSDCEYDDERDEWVDSAERAFCRRGFRVGSVVVYGEAEPIDPFERYAGAYQSVTWADVLGDAS